MAGILDTILAQVDNAKRVATANTKDFLNNPKDFLAMVQGRMAENNKKIADGFDSGDTSEAASAALNLTPAAAGMIRKGGRVDLNMTHETRLDNLVKMLTGRATLSNPSIAIASDNIAPFRGANASSASIVMNPSSHRFDPELNPQNLLVNRDAYTDRSKDILPAFMRYGTKGSPQESMKATEGLELSVRDPNRYYTANNLDNIPGGQQLLSILASPEFKSFRQYEKLPSGAATLDSKAPSTISVHQAAYEIDESVDPAALAKTINGHTPLMDGETLVSQIKARAEAANKLPKDEFFNNIQAQNDSILWDSLRNTKSDYAELKVPGQVSLDKNTVSAIMLHPDVNYTQKTKKAIANAEQLGIRIGTPEQLMPAEHRALYDEHMPAALYKELLSDSYSTETASKLSKDYLGNGAAFHRMLAKDSTEEAAIDVIKSDIKRSDKYAADVAAMLTGKDADITSNTLKLLLEKANQ